MTLFDREDLIDALRALVVELRSAGEPVGPRIVGGAALALRHYDRSSTADLDALHVRPGDDAAVVAAADRVALRRGWSAGWLNFAVAETGGEPLLGRPTTWETIHDDGLIVIEVAGAETLLAMKLRANRPGRDTDDIRRLLVLCDISTIDEADSFFSDFYPGDSLSDRAWRMVTAILDGEDPDDPAPMEPVELG
ncbi:hypothetical protein MT349_14785 [Rathayibacter caricis]|uniref:hypothetical protein n=1 Tax=Rathayibacter caricis TaxID=110936 RepID=UPI001FB27316|nr:hypothetical protein [Rathayibacter caricis]MCJ1697046.1 hypothetical protein [Rathayibacter caricis]